MTTTRATVAASPTVFLGRGDCINILSGIADAAAAGIGSELSGGAAGPASRAAVEGSDDDDGNGALVSEVLDALYEELEEVFLSRRGYLIPKREADLVDATGGSSTYGEISGDGVRQFLRSIPLQPDDVLVDLGSGLGRLTLQVACSARLRRCVGIELSETRHEQAGWVAARLAELGQEAAADERAVTEVEEGPEPPPPTVPQLQLTPVELRREDLLTADLADGSAFFMCSTAFSASACRAVAERLSRHAPFRLLVTSRALPFPSPLVLVGQFRCAFTWTGAGTAYVYVRSLREAPPRLLAAFLAVRLPLTPDEEEADEEAARGVGGIAWLPSTSTLCVVPGDLLV